jgi:atypical dual specificity phosphatase
LHPTLARWIWGPTFAWNYLLGRVFRKRNWWDPIDEFVLLGAMPLRSDVGPLYELGVRGVVNMCEEYPGPTAEYAKVGIEQLWLPTTDFHHPTLDHVASGVEFVESFVRKQKIVYVHCKAGRARSATIIICWLVKYRGMNLQDAQQRLLSCRPHVNRTLADRPVVMEYCRGLSRR